VIGRAGSACTQAVHEVTCVVVVRAKRGLFNEYKTWLKTDSYVMVRWHVTCFFQVG
jgi:hypothetical protein